MVAPPQGSGPLRAGVRLEWAKQDGPRRDWGAGCWGDGQRSLGPAASLSSKDLSISRAPEPQLPHAGTLQPPHQGQGLILTRQSSHLATWQEKSHPYERKVRSQIDA